MTLGEHILAPLKPEIRCKHAGGAPSFAQVVHNGLRSFVYVYNDKCHIKGPDWPPDSSLQWNKLNQTALILNVGEAKHHSIIYFGVILNRKLNRF